LSEPATHFDVSIVIPTFNRATLVTEAIESCLTEGGPTLRVQVVVVDDHSTDNTSEVLASFAGGIESITLPDNGRQSRARNVGMTLARGRYLKFLDSDDVLEPGVLRDEVELADTRSADMVVTGHRVGSRENGPCSYEEMDLVDLVLLGRAEPTSAVLYRSEYVEGLQWEETLSKLDDWYWFAMAAHRRGKIERLARVSYVMREHGGPRASSESTMLKNAREHHQILHSIECEIARQGDLTDGRRRRLAQYYYKELRVLSLYDRNAFDASSQHILELDPDFIPIDEERQWYMRAFARVVGFRTAVRTHTSLKRLFRRHA
jgi:glycosyltransferase involved in cell wall biosynthesis